MKKVILEFLSHGTILSSMRLGSLLMVSSSCFYVLSLTTTNLLIKILNIFFEHHYAAHKLIDFFTIDWVGAATFAGAGLLGKAGQSFAEKKFTKPTEETTQVEEKQTTPVKEVG